MTEYRKRLAYYTRKAGRKLTGQECWAISVILNSAVSTQHNIDVAFEIINKLET